MGRNKLGREREKMIWIILIADFISGNPVQQHAEPAETSYFNSIITTLMQAVVVSSMSLVLLYAMFQAKSYFTNPRSEPNRTEQRLYRQCLGDEDFSESIFESRRRMTNLESVPVWQVPKVKSHRTNH